MLKGFPIQEQQHQQRPVLLENMSNLTSASNEASGSSGTNIRSEAGSGATVYPPEYLTSNPSVQPAKRKRNLPGNPDPEAEVIALSPKTLMATNRFLCEICNKGFQRDQNLQLHRRGHNLPWKLKQRSIKEIRKKVYVCPEASCVHHDPLRALGDLTGIKKHFCRKHGEKKWKCEKCSKRYAVQSDWKAHSKICGTREYRCDCGTLFSRRDSFITHRAFCDALAEESARAISGNPLLGAPSHHHQANSNLSISQSMNLPPAAASHHFNFTHDQIQAFSATMKKEQQSFPPWLATTCPAPVPSPFDFSSTPSSFFNSASDFAQAPHHHLHQHQQLHHQDLSSVTIQGNPSPNPSTTSPSLGPNLPPYHSTLQPIISPHMSATALLQKAAQMGSTMSQPRPHPQAHVPASTTTTTTATANDSSLGGSNNHNSAVSAFGLNLSPREDQMSSGGFVMPTSSHFGSFEDAFGGILNSRKDGPFSENNLTKSAMPHPHDDDDHHHQNEMVERNNLLMKGNGTGNNNNEGLTRDFLGLRPLSHSDILDIANLGDCMNDEQHQDQQKSW